MIMKRLLLKTFFFMNPKRMMNKNNSFVYYNSVKIAIWK